MPPPDPDTPMSLHRGLPCERICLDCGPNPLRAHAHWDGPAFVHDVDGPNGHWSLAVLLREADNGTPSVTLRQPERLEGERAG